MPLTIKQALNEKDKLQDKSNLIYKKLENLENQEKSLLELGKSSFSKSKQRHLAVQLAEVRKELKRYTTKVEIINRNIEVLSLHISNHEFIKDNGEIFVHSDELKNVSDKADRVITKLKDDYDLVETFESSDQLMSGEELDILEEFERHKEF